MNRTITWKPDNAATYLGRRRLGIMRGISVRTLPPQVGGGDACVEIAPMDSGATVDESCHMRIPAPQVPAVVEAMREATGGSDKEPSPDRCKRIVDVILAQHPWLLHGDEQINAGDLVQDMIRAVRSEIVPVPAPKGKA